MDDFTKALFSAAESLGIELSTDAAERMRRYYGFLVSENEKHNLTTIVRPEEAAVKHFIDSLAPARLIEDGADFVDIGSGAGFPAVPVKIFRDDINVSAVEASGKKCGFIEQASSGVSARVGVIAGRAEELGRDAAHRERYDIAAARALAGFPILLELCSPFVRPGGRLFLYKSVEEDLSAAKTALDILCLEVEDVLEYTLPGQARRVYVIRKRAATPEKYPRKFAAIKKRPL